MLGVVLFVHLLLGAHGVRTPWVLRRRTLCSGVTAAACSPTAAFAKSRVEHYPVQSIDGKDWLEVLSSGQYYILRQGGTEPPNSSPLVSEKRRGVFVCAGCVAPLFDSTQKFESGTGWPSFAAARTGVETVPTFGNLLGAEVRCGRCGGHLGVRASARFEQWQSGCMSASEVVARAPATCGLDLPLSVRAPRRRTSSRTARAFRERQPR